MFPSYKAKLGTRFPRPIDYWTVIRKSFTTTSYTNAATAGTRQPGSKTTRNYPPLEPPLRRFWSAEEDRIILDLKQQNYTDIGISQQLQGRSVRAIASRLHTLTTAGCRSGGRPAYLGTAWTEQEDALMIRMREEGKEFSEIAQCLPGRTLSAVQFHYYDIATRLNASKQLPATDITRGRYSEQDIQRIVHLRVEERKGFREIALEMNRSRQSVYHLWRKHCLSFVSEEVLRSLRRVSDWTCEEDDVILRLHKEGVSATAIAETMSFKTTMAVRRRLRTLQYQSQGRAGPGQPRMEAMEVRRALQPVVDGTRTMREVHAMFPHLSAHSLVNRLWKLRHGLYKTKTTDAPR